MVIVFRGSEQCEVGPKSHSHNFRVQSTGTIASHLKLPWMEDGWWPGLKPCLAAVQEVGQHLISELVEPETYIKTLWMGCSVITTLTLTFSIDYSISNSQVGTGGGRRGVPMAGTLVFTPLPWPKITPHPL